MNKPVQIFLLSVLFIFFCVTTNMSAVAQLSSEKITKDKTEKNISNTDKDNKKAEEKEFTKKENPVKASSDNSLYSLFRKGGFFMWPLLIFAAVGMGYIIERLIFFKKANLNPREFILELEEIIKNKKLEALEEFLKGKNLILSRIILKGLKIKSLGFEHVEKALSIAGSIEVAALERGLNILSAVGNIVPMLGFLGTVSGMISAFANIAAADQVNAKLVAGGIEEALLTTAAGLIIAIPTLAFYNYFVHRIDGFIADVERLSSDLLERLVEENGKN